MRRWVILKGEGGDSRALTRAAFEGEGQALDRARTDELCWSSNRKRWRWQPTGQNPAAKAGNNVAAATRLQGQPDPSHPLRPLANAPASSRLLPRPIGPLKLIGFPGARPFRGLREVARSLPHFRRGSHAESGRRGRVGPLALYTATAVSFQCFFAALYRDAVIYHLGAGPCMKCGGFLHCLQFPGGRWTFFLEVMSSQNLSEVLMPVVRISEPLKIRDP